MAQPASTTAPRQAPAPAQNGNGRVNGAGPARRGGRIAERVRRDPWRIAPVALTSVIAIAYLIIAPRTPDLAGHMFRAELFGREGFAIWNGQWYGGHHTLSYSVLAPPLSWLLGPQLMGAIAAVAATACFEPLAHRHFGAAAARWGSLWFAIGVTTNLFTNRLPFALGVAFGVAALLALQRGRRWPAVALAVLCGLSSPVAGAFLCMAALAYLLAASGPDRASARRAGAAIGAAALVPPVFISVAFPEEGYAPFEAKFWIPILLLGGGVAALAPRRERAIRIGAALYLAGGTLALIVPTMIGITTTRLGALVGGPIVLCLAWDRLRGRMLPALVPVLIALMYWQWAAPVGDLRKAIDDPVADASYFDPLREWLRLRPDQRRIEIPFTYGHWEGAEMASEAQLARGWLRQLDTGRHPIFYKGRLNEATYASWLSENAVRYVALPDAKPDSSSYTERAIIEGEPPYLKLRRQFDNWRIYEVTLPTPIVIPQDDANISLEQIASDEVLLRVRRPGEALVRVRWSQYWLAKGGCVERDGDWTRVTAYEEGFVRLVTRFSPERIFDRGRRCNR